MASERRDYDDAYTTRFEAKVVAAGEHGGRPALELEATYFYPEGGGQEADRGRVGPWRVADVQSDEAGRVWHVIEGEPAVPERALDAEVDWTRRFDHMQQHTGQHVLSAAFERVANAPTLSSHLGAEKSAIEVGLDAAGWENVARIEAAANAVVWEDREVMRHWVDEEGVKRLALRKPPRFGGRIRIVEIPDWDVSACGGTHTRRTGEVGLVKIVRWEKVRGNLRFEFLCGRRAFEDYAWRTAALLEAARQRTIHDRDVIAHLERAAEERDALKKRLREVLEREVASEARARVGDPPAAVEDFASDRPRDLLRLFAIKCLEAGAPWVAAGTAGPEPAVMAGVRRGGASDLRALLPDLLALARGKGGGSPELIQISAADASSAEACWRRAVEALRAAAATE